MKCLKKINLRSVSEHLSSKEMRRILGGGEGGYGTGTCGIKYPDSSTVCNISKAEVMFILSPIDTSNYWWCCDSCKSNGGSASYC